MVLNDVKQGFASLWESVSEGWQRVRQSAAGALIRFMPGDHSVLAGKSEVDDDFYFPSQGWALLGGDVFEDDRRVMVRSVLAERLPAHANRLAHQRPQALAQGVVDRKHMNPPGALDLVEFAAAFEARV